jgi:predicted signal transduction protein with EAL and GGDEF domain
MTRTLTINSSITGFKYFEVNITKLTGHTGEETLVFTHYRNGKMLGVFASLDDYDTKTKATAGFNVAPGDKIKVFIVDKLTSSPDENPTIL